MQYLTANQQSYVLYQTKSTQKHLHKKLYSLHFTQTFGQFCQSNFQIMQQQKETPYQCFS